jgi:hypothetical protein
LAQLSLLASVFLYDRGSVYYSELQKLSRIFHESLSISYSSAKPFRTSACVRIYMTLAKLDILFLHTRSETLVVHAYNSATFAFLGKFKIVVIFLRMYNERASQLLQIHKASIGPLTLLQISYADEDDPNFALDAVLSVFTPQESKSRAALMNRRINACTKGLLDAELKQTQELASVKSEWLHRTVKDYFARDDVWRRICAAAPAAFDSNLRLANCFTIQLKTQEIS